MRATAEHLIQKQPLSRAAKRRQWDVCSLLLQTLDFSYLPQEVNSALRRAAVKGQISLVLQLLTANKLPSSRSNSRPLDVLCDVALIEQDRANGIADALKAAAGSSNSTICNVLLIHLDAAVRRRFKDRTELDNRRAAYVGQALKAAAKKRDHSICSSLCDHMARMTKHSMPGIKAWVNHMTWALCVAGNNRDERLHTLLAEHKRKLLNAEFSSSDAE
jgi:hypothetical protein